MGKRILVVDDEEDFLFSIKTVLDTSQEQYATITINSCEKALDYLRQNEPPDLIILDIAFPEMNGFEFYEVLKQNEQWAHIPILFTTALGDEENKRNATKKGTVFLEKPITIDDLFKTIDWIF